MIALYAFTALLRSQVPTVSVVIVGALAVLTWCVWDPSPRCLAVALGSAAVATVGEGLLLHSGVHHYAPDSNALFGLAPWLPCLFFAQGAVASGLWNALWDDRKQDAPTIETRR
jgi:FtsH-binding integral membrane protein